MGAAVGVAASAGGTAGAGGLVSRWRRLAARRILKKYIAIMTVTLPIGLQDWNHRFAVNLSHKAYFILYVTELVFFAQISAFQRSRLEA